MSERYLKVSEVAEILRVSQMTVIRKCREGVLPFIRVGTMRRIRESDLEFYISNPYKKPKAPGPERPVYDGPPADLNGFEDDVDAGKNEMIELRTNAQPVIDAKRAKIAGEVKAPTPQLRITDETGTGLYPSGFPSLSSLLDVYADEDEE